MKEENKSCLSTIIYIVGIICAFIDFMFLLAMVYKHPIMQIPTALGICEDSVVSKQKNNIHYKNRFVAKQIIFEMQITTSPRWISLTTYSYNNRGKVCPCKQLGNANILYYYNSFL